MPHSRRGLWAILPLEAVWAIPISPSGPSSEAVQAAVFGMTERRWGSLVGREREIGRVQLALDRAAGGQGGLLVVSGEPGIGKTRLVEELAARATRSGALVAWGRIEEDEGTPPYWPWIQMLGTVLAGAERTTLGEALETSAGVIAAIVPEVKEFVTRIVPPPMLDPAEARFHLHQAIVDFLTRLNARQRLVVVIEDVHWADVASLELARFVAARVGEAGILLALTYRTVDAGRSETFADVLASLARLRALERIPLTGFTEEEVGQFIVQTLEVEAETTAISAVHARTEGNPFFVRELARLLESEGLLGGEKGGERPSGGVPTGVRDVVRRRLARLPEATRDIMELAAVIGRDFDLGLLAAAAGCGEVGALDAVGPAMAAGLVADDVAVVGRFRFSHALVRDTVYGELTALRKATLHARVGTALECHPSAGARLAELAGHFVHAVPVLGPGQAFAYTLEAAQAAQAALAYERAEDDLVRALGLVELLPAGPERLEQELDVLNRLTALMIITRGYSTPEVGQACTRARQLCREIGETEGLFRALNSLSVFHHVRGDLSVTREFAGQLLAIGGQRSNRRWLTAGHLLLGMAQLHTGRLTEARDNLAAVREVGARLELSTQVAEEFFGPHPLPMSLVYSSRTTWALGDEVEAEALAEEGIRLATQLGHPHTLVFAWYLGTHLQILLGHAAVVQTWAERAITYCDTHSFTAYQGWFRIFRGWAMCEQGRGEEVVAGMRAAVAVHLATGARINSPIFLGLLADAEARVGDLPRALALVDQALAVKGEDQLWESDLLRRRGELLVALGPQRVKAGRESLRKAVEVAARQGAAGLRRRAEAALADVERAGRTEGAGAGAGSNLSRRERELLGLVGLGLTDKEIAGRLVISLATVHSHLDRIRDKTGRRRRPELTRLAVELGLTSD